MNLFELQRLPTNVDNRATSIFIIESAGFKYQFQSVIHIGKELSAMVQIGVAIIARGGMSPHPAGGNLSHARRPIKKILPAGGK